MTVTVSVPTTPKPSDVYTTPGFHSSGGRWWSTTCEPYSQTIRCRTEIWSTHVTYDKGQFRSETGWHFNNLTYLPKMTRAQWASNPLGTTGTWTSDGRRWKTECDTPQTGRKGCRSWIWSPQVVKSTQSTTGAWMHSLHDTWVFNNIVKFR